MIERKARLEALIPRQSGVVRYSASLGTNGEVLLEQARKLGLEGLIGKLKFSEWTNDGKLRQPVFLGIREDKDASEVTHEKPNRQYGQLIQTPVTWDEVERALKKKSAGMITFEAEDVLKRVQKQGGLFEPVLKLKQQLPALAAMAEAAE